MQSNQSGGRWGKMTKSNKFLLTGAAIAGLLAGTGASVQASNLLPGAKASATAQDTEKKADKKVKEKHACKGQNSCKGKGRCTSWTRSWSNTKWCSMACPCILVRRKSRIGSTCAA